ncbi:hypothetical protein ACF0H5_022159 [Mactra antiquata]
MKSLAVLLLFGALIGFSACMSVVEFEEDNDVKENELGFWFSFGFGVGDVADEKNGVLGCTGNPCYLCKKSSFDVNLHKNMVKTAYEYNGCVIITKTPDNKYMVGVTIDDKLQYANAYERLNENVNLPCIYPNESKPEGKICPHIYNVDLENGKMCASLDEYMHVMDTNMRHENNLGCAEIY